MVPSSRIREETPWAWMDGEVVGGDGTRAIRSPRNDERWDASKIYKGEEENRKAVERRVGERAVRGRSANRDHAARRNRLSPGREGGGSSPYTHRERSEYSRGGVFQVKSISFSLRGLGDSILLNISQIALRFWRTIIDNLPNRTRLFPRVARTIEWIQPGTAKIAGFA